MRKMKSLLTKCLLRTARSAACALSLWILWGISSPLTADQVTPPDLTGGKVLREWTLSFVVYFLIGFLEPCV